MEVQKPPGGQTEGMKRGLSKNTQQHLRVSLSKMETYEAHVATCSPCTWPWCHGGGKATRKEGMETSGNLDEVFTFLCSCAPTPHPQKPEEQPNKRCFTCFSQKTLVEMCVQVPAEKAPVVTWDRLAWLPHWCSCRNGRVSPEALRGGFYFCCYWDRE